MKSHLHHIAAVCLFVDSMEPCTLIHQKNPRDQVGKATVLACMGEAAAAAQSDGKLDQIIEAQNLDALSKAAVCAILAPAGPERSRLLAMLNKDERTLKLPMHSMLQKIYMERVVRAPEIELFQQELKPHQMAVTSDGLTVIQKAMIEHNLFAAAHLYNNITFEELGFFLHLPPEKAEVRNPEP